jgi:hypothetical protein
LLCQAFWLSLTFARLWPVLQFNMIKNGLYALNATSRDENASDVGGVLILRDGHIRGGDAYVFYTGNYKCSAGHWQGKMTSQEHTPTGRPMAARVQHIGFLGTYNDAGATVDAMALIGNESIRYDAKLRLLLAL